MKLSRAVKNGILLIAIHVLVSTFNTSLYTHTQLRLYAYSCIITENLGYRETARACV